MNWLEEAQMRIKRRNQILLSKDSTFLDDLKVLLEQQNHQTLVLWALELAEETAKFLALKYPNDYRFESAVLLTKDWAAGRIKMNVAKHAILQVHAVAKEIVSLEDIALCHALGQACSVVHTSKHALGYPLYELTAIIRHYGIPECERIVEKRKQHYLDRIYYWKNHYNDDNHVWVGFLLSNDINTY